ncbi:MAG: hypothetical protein ACLVLP_09335 [Phascolarctobacterium faecium]|uniref:hypothetical protein n=1 Tax=Phascolarctobacterium faecium TaxID=33025 RepID=UPI00399B2217
MIEKIPCKSGLCCIWAIIRSVFFLSISFFMYLCTEYLLPLLQITPSMLTFYPLLFVLMLVLSLGSMEILARLPFHELLIGKVERRLLLRRKSGRTNSL